MPGNLIDSLNSINFPNVTCYGCVGKFYGSTVQKTQCLCGLCRVLRVWPPKRGYVPSFILIIMLIVILIGFHRVLWVFRASRVVWPSCRSTTLDFPSI